MWQASVGWMRQAVDAAMVSGSLTAVIAYSLLHSQEMLRFLRCSLIGCGQSPDP
jgi:hypothetical protein